MKEYPSIQYYNKGIYGSTVHVFDKLDGSNLRIEYNRKSGFYKFGTRNCLINRNTEIYGVAIDIFLKKYSDIEKIFNSKQFRNIQNFTLYSEFLGDNSFAGAHDPNDIKDVILFDIWQYKKGFIEPDDFLNYFSEFGIPKYLGKYEYNEEFIKTIQNNNELKEGVVCKGLLNKKGQANVWMTKIKTKQWLDKIRLKMGDKALLDELNGDKNLLL